MAWVECPKQWINSKNTTPLGSVSDIGRRVLRKNESGWASIGVITGFEPFVEERLVAGAAIEGEIGEEASALFKAQQEDNWVILFGNGAEDYWNVAEVAYGLQLYLKMTNTPELRTSMDITADMLNPTSKPSASDITVLETKSRGSRVSTGGIGGESEGGEDMSVDNAIEIQAAAPSSASVSLECPQCHKKFKSPNGFKYHCEMNVCGPKTADVITGPRVRKKAETYGPSWVSWAAAIEEAGGPIPLPSSSSSISQSSSSQSTMGSGRKKRQPKVLLESVVELQGYSDSEPEGPPSKRTAVDEDSEGGEDDSGQEDDALFDDDFDEFEPTPRSREQSNGNFLSYQRMWKDSAVHKFVGSCKGMSTVKTTESQEGRLCAGLSVPSSVVSFEDWVQEIQQKSVTRSGSSVGAGAGAGAGSGADADSPMPALYPRVPSDSIAVTLRGSTSDTLVILPPLQGVIQGGCSEEGSLSGLQVYLNTNAPIWDMAFAPPSVHRSSPDHADGSLGSVLSSAKTTRVGAETVLERHLLVSLSRVGWPVAGEVAKSLVTRTCGVGVDRPHVLTERSDFDNVLQLWRLKFLSDRVQLTAMRNGQATVSSRLASSSSSSSTDASQAESQVELHYCVELSRRGAAWKVSWMPNIHHSDLILGVCAVVCGDGSCLILVLPRCLPVPFQAETATVGPHRSAGRVPVLREQAVRRCVISLTGNAVLCADWSPHSPGTLACGMQDGSIRLWRLTDILDGATEPSHPFCILSDFSESYSDPCFCAVLSVQFCPYHPNLLCSGGLDGCAKVWNTLSPHSPAYVRKTGLGWLYDVRWEPTGYGIVFCGSDTTSVCFDPMWASRGKFKVKLYSHISKYSGVWRLCPANFGGVPLVVSAASDGSLRGGFIPALCRSRVAGSPTEFSRTYSVLVPTASSQPHTSNSSEASTGAGTSAGADAGAGAGTSAVAGASAGAGDTCRIDVGVAGIIELKNKSSQTPLETDLPLLPDMSVALHAVTLSAVTRDEGGMYIVQQGKSLDCQFLIASGGASGLAIIQCKTAPGEFQN